MIKKVNDYSKDKIKENCVIEFLCLSESKSALSIRSFIDKIKAWFKSYF